MYHNMVKNPEQHIKDCSCLQSFDVILLFALLLSHIMHCAHKVLLMWGQLFRSYGTCWSYWTTVSKAMPPWSCSQFIKACYDLKNVLQLTRPFCDKGLV